MVDVLKPGLGLLCLLNLLLQDAPLSDCTETIEGLDLTEQAFSPAKSLSVRKVLTALSYCSKYCCSPFTSTSPYSALLPVIAKELALMERLDGCTNYVCAILQAVKLPF